MQLSADGPERRSRIPDRRSGWGRSMVAAHDIIVASSAAVLLMASPAVPCAAAPAIPAAMTALSSQKFGQAVTGLAFGPEPGDVALTFADGSGEVFQNGRETLHLSAQADTPPVSWVPGSYWVVQEVHTGGYAGIPPGRAYALDAASGDVEQSDVSASLPPCAVQSGLQVLEQTVAWVCGNRLSVRPVTAAGVGLLSATIAQSYSLPEAPLRNAGSFAVDSGRNTIALRDRTGVRVYDLGTDRQVGGAIHVGQSAPVKLAWSPSGAELAVAVGGTVYVWAPGKGGEALARFTTMPHSAVTELQWTADGSAVEVLAQAGTGDTPRDWLLALDSFSGSSQTIARGRMGYVLGIDPGGYVWREEGVLPGVYSGDPGLGPFWLEAVPVRSLVNAAPTVPYGNPTAVAPVRVAGTWQMASGAAGWNGTPLALGFLNGPNSGGVQAAPGQSVQIAVMLENQTTSAVQFRTPISFSVTAWRDVEGTRTAVWRGVLPALFRTLPGGMAQELIVSWNQLDADGQQVPPGKYDITLTWPAPMLELTVGSKSVTETLPSNTDLIGGQWYDEPVIIGSYLLASS